MRFKIDNKNEINIKFLTTSGLYVIIAIDKNKTIKSLLKEYAQRVGFSENYLGTEIIFILDAQIIDVNDIRPIDSLFSNDHLKIVTVVDKIEVGGNNFNYS